MGFLGVFIVSLVVIAITCWVYRWKNPKFNGVLPPGSMGLPLIGETFQFLTTSKSVDMPRFIKTRINKYGLVFKTSLVGRPVVVSSDPDLNYYILQQEGKLVEMWYMDSFAKIFGQGDSAKPGSPPTTALGNIHKFIRTAVLSQIGVESLKEKILPDMEDVCRQTLHAWAMTRDTLELKRATSAMIFDFTANILFGYEPEKSNDKNLSEMLSNFLQGLMSFPLNVPGTTFHKCLKNQRVGIQLMKKLMNERMASPEKRRGDFLDHYLDGMKTESFITEDFVLYSMFGLLFASFETISSTLSLAIMYLSDHPEAVKELEREQEEILRVREDKGSKVTWEEYKSMTFTMQVVNESLRMASVAPGILRRAIKDINANGYTIPKGWTILVVPSALQMNPKVYDDPLSFNPWRWKELEKNVVAKNFIPFGGGLRTCAGSEFSKAFMAVFLHVLVTGYSWEKVKGTELYRSPVLGFGDGFHIKLLEKNKDQF